MFNDINILNQIPNSEIYCPASYNELKNIIDEYMNSENKIFFVRLNLECFDLNKNIKFEEYEYCPTLLSTGWMTNMYLENKDKLKNINIKHFNSLKDLYSYADENYSFFVFDQINLYSKFKFKGIDKEPKTFENWEDALNYYNLTIDEIVQWITTWSEK